ncbi:hypothetical protein BJ912DRAFT_1067821 [Pholiota molesta]|nr:hypothetical protein BJ912DRAFT_1067821 [Pholiota molesta]
MTHSAHSDPSSVPFPFFFPPRSRPLDAKPTTRPPPLPRDPPERRAPLRDARAHPLDSNDTGCRHYGKPTLAPSSTTHPHASYSANTQHQHPPSALIPVILNSPAHPQHGSAPYTLAADRIIIPARVRPPDARTTARTPSRRLHREITRPNLPAARQHITTTNATACAGER